MGRRQRLAVHHNYRKFSILKEHIFTTRKKNSLKILKSLKDSPSKRIREGEFYVLKYAADSSFSTDKWHQISLLYVTEINSSEITGYNVLYLPPKICENIVKESLKVKKFKASNFRSMLEAEIGNSESYGFCKKSYKLSRILSCSSVPREEWPQISTLDRKPFGNLDAKSLYEDWKLEKRVEIVKKSKKKKDEKALPEEETFEVQESGNAREVIFEEKKEENLNTLKDEIEFDDIDI
jgi:hypothetical protein